MHASINWLKEYVDFTWSGEELAHRLTMAGIAIEDVQEVEGDSILGLDLTPNRGDCLGIINLAREVAALTGHEVSLPAIDIRETGDSISDLIRVEISAPDLCPRYTARLVRNVKIKPSPQWMQDRLLSCGVRPINNVVDVTNYVMLECNQPLHAFDYDLLSQAKTILVRRAQAGEKITTLDGVERVLNGDSLLITDDGHPVALAGVMGGQNTEIGADTVNVLLESAYFQNIGIRRTSRLVGLRSDSSIRFEKGTDVNGVVYAVNRAAYLLQELAEAEVVSGVADCYPQPLAVKQVVLRPARVNYLLGTEMSADQVRGYIDSLHFTCQVRDGDLIVTIPSYRPDIDLEADLIEEVARLYGYDSIPAQLPPGITQGGLTPFQAFRDQVSRFMAGWFYEAVNYSFVATRYFDMLRLPSDSPLREVVVLANPLSEEQAIMRTILLPGLLETVSRNLARKNSNLAFFEMGSVFHPRPGSQPREVLKLAAVVAGRADANWFKTDLEMDFYHLKGVAENLLSTLGIEAVEWVEGHDISYHPGRCASLRCGQLELGVLGEIHPLVRQNFDIKPRACGLELDLHQLFELSRLKVMSAEVPRYPAVERDIAIIVPQDLRAARAESVISRAGGDLLKKVSIFDVYTGEPVAAGYKSMAYKMTFQSGERTLTEAEVTSLMEDIRAALSSELQVSTR
ncbi:MAG: phenylalanine--tRNA ligase subunit beta [Syntrophomonas sp.]|nr:phenylalanine--tRNA ligase subunit beta [Syntrophomonas sp.]